MPLNPNAKPFVPASRKINEADLQDTLNAINNARNAYSQRLSENAAINEAVSLANTEAAENAAIAEAVNIEAKSRKALHGGSVDNMVLQMPKVGYTQLPSDSMGGNAGILADGKTPFMLNIPYSTSPSSALACMKGGKRKAKKSTRKAKKATRKSRKSVRKSKKATRKSRKSRKVKKTHRKH